MRIVSNYGLLFFTSFALLDIAHASQQCIPPPSFSIPTQTNFKTCYDKIQNLTIDERRQSSCFKGELEAGILTLDGCKILCGGGVNFWEWKDIFSRLSLLILPTVVLIADLGFPPLGWHTYLILPVQAIGNPIGSFQSLLIRFTNHRAQRRLLQPHLSRRQILLSKSLATVYAAYEEFGWLDLAAAWPVTLSENEQRIIVKASYELSSTRLKSRVSALVAIATLVGTLITAIVRTIKQVNPSNARVYNETAHTIAVVCILFVTIPQVWFGARIGTFTTDAGAIHILETMRDELDTLDVPDRQTAPLFPPLQLATCPGHGPRTWLSRCLPERMVIFFSRCPLEQTATHLGLPTLSREPEWRGISGNFTGINSSWRGCTRMPVDSRAPSHFQLSLISFLFAIGGAGLPAYFLSASNNSVKRKVGIGCRSISWITIMVLWIISFALERFFRGYVCKSSAGHAPVYKLRRIWMLSTAKNLIVTCLVIILVLLVEVGRYNSCQCRSSFREIVNLMGYTAPEWERAKRLWSTLPLGGLIVNFGLIMWVESAYWNVHGRWGWVPRFAVQGGTLLCKDEAEMEAEWNELRDLARGTAGSIDLGMGSASNDGAVELRPLEEGPSLSRGEQLQLLEKRAVVQTINR